MKYLSYLIISLVVIVCACNDSIEIGNALLEDEQVGVEVDTLSLQAQTVLADSVLTFRKQDDENFINSVYLVGQLEDSQFGASEATAYFSPTLIQAVPDLDTFIIDSVVMVLKLDSLGRYGGPNVVHNLELFELTESIVADQSGETLYSFDEINFQPTPLLSQSLLINYQDSITLDSTYTNDTISQQLVPQLRFEMDKRLWRDLLTSRDTITGEVLEELIPGYALKSTVDNSTLGIDLSYVSGASEIVFYMYTVDTSDGSKTNKREYRLPLGRLRHNNFGHDYTSSDVEAAITNTNSDLLYLESMGGTDVEIDLAVIKDLTDNTVLNNASIEMTIIDGFDEELFPSPQGLFASFINDDSTKSTVVDILLSENGVRLIERAGIEYYVMDVTRQANLILAGDIESSKIRVFTDAKAQRPNRAIIGGPSHPEFPMRLKVIKSNP